MTRVLIVDDHAHFRDRIRPMLESEGYQVVGEAADGRGAVAIAGSLAAEGSAVELAIVDVGLPDLDGFAVAAALLALDPRMAVVLTSSRESVDPGRVRASGARGFLPKEQLSGPALARLLAAAPDR